jgi:GTP-binding protein
MRAEKSIARADVVVLVMDAEEGPTLQDKKIAALVLEHRKGCILLINKWDLAGSVTQRSYEKALRAALPFLSFAPIIFVSAKSGFNIRRTIETIDYVAAQVSMTLATGMLNRVLHDAVDRVQPPMMKGARLRFYYATQVGTRPVRLRMFVNDPRRMNDAYKQYLIHALRAAYGLEGAPVTLDLKSSHKDRSGSSR